MHLCCLLTRLNEENALEAKRAGELVRSLGVEHHIVSLKWGGKLHAPPRSFVITEKRHLSMLSFCQRKNIRTLMIAHHLDDQIGKQCLRGSESNG